MIRLDGIPVIDTPRLRLRGPEAADFAAFMASPHEGDSTHETLGGSRIFRHPGPEAVSMTGGAA